MKKTISLLTAILLLFSFFTISCGKWNGWSQYIADICEKNNYAKLLLKGYHEDKNESLEELTAYDFDVESYREIIGPIAGWGGTYRTPLERYNEMFPVEILIKTGENGVFTIHKTVLDSGEEAYVYIHFLKLSGENNQKGWATPGHECVIFSKKLDELLPSADYMNLQVGDSMADAIAVDPTIIFNYHVEVPGSNIFLVPKITSDGVVQLLFKSENSSSPAKELPPPEELVLTRITFCPLDDNEDPWYGHIMPHIRALVESAH